MKVSLNWVKEFTKVDLSIDELVEKIGAQLGAVEQVINLGERYQGIVIVKVVECKKLEGSDHLSLCRVDDGGKAKDVERGSDGFVQVVCGAPNCKQGMLVAWLPPGVTVPSSWDGDKFVLEAREIRGQKSNGMLASAKELAIGDSHEGLLELDEGKPGDDFAATYKMDDYIIDIENKMFTHRPDLFGMLGVAREIAGISHQQFRSPNWYLAKTPVQAGNGLALEVKNELPGLVPRFMAVALQGVTIGPSPVWLQTYLSRVGVRPINNVVDATNYMMLLTGQPQHAYDYDKVKAQSGGTATLIVRNPHSNEKLTLLNGKEIQPRPEAIVIATDKQAIGLGGVMGGADTEVDASTQNIILECATFDMYSIRRTSMEHGIFSDAVTRYTKGQSPFQNQAVLTKTIELLTDVAGAKVASPVIDDNHTDIKDIPEVKVAVDFVNVRLGLALDANEMSDLLTNVEFENEGDDETITVGTPFWRTDIELREDVVEEVGRLYGYDHLPLELPKRDLTPAPKDQLLELKSRVRDVLSAAGASEVLTYSFVHGNLLEKAGQDREQAFQLNNALSPDLQYYRLSLTPSLLASIHPNVKAGYDRFVLFEIGKAHNQTQKDSDGLPTEFEMLDVVFAASSKADVTGAAFYQARKYLTDLCGTLGLPLEFRPIEAEEDYQVAKPYDHKRSAKIFVLGTDIALGMIGEYKASAAKAFKLPKFTAGFGIGLAALQEALTHSAQKYVALPKYPKVTQDISLKVPSELSYRELYRFVWDAISKVRPENALPALSPVDIYQGGDKKTKNITFRLEIASYERTLTDQEVNNLLDKVAEAAKAKFGAERL
jgi:phenylalanyl-tRNA synthetase beta chain